MERRITVEEASIYEEDYQMRMLEANDIEGILKVRGRVSARPARTKPRNTISWVAPRLTPSTARSAMRAP